MRINKKVKIIKRSKSPELVVITPLLPEHSISKQTKKVGKVSSQEGAEP